MEEAEAEDGEDAGSEEDAEEADNIYHGGRSA